MPNLSIGKTRLLSTLQLSWVREGKGVEGGGAGIRGVVGGGLGGGWWPLGGGWWVVGWGVDGD